MHYFMYYETFQIIRFNSSAVCSLVFEHWALEHKLRILEIKDSDFYQTTVVWCNSLSCIKALCLLGRSYNSSKQDHREQQAAIVVGLWSHWSQNIPSTSELWVSMTYHLSSEDLSLLTVWYSHWLTVGAHVHGGRAASSALGFLFLSSHSLLKIHGLIHNSWGPLHETKAEQLSARHTDVTCFTGVQQILTCVLEHVLHLYNV